MKTKKNYMKSLKLIILLSSIFVVLLSVSSIAPAKKVISRTATSDTIENEDGTYTLILYSGVVNMKDIDGVYKPFTEVVKIDQDAPGTISVTWKDNWLDISTKKEIETVKSDFSKENKLSTELIDRRGSYEYIHKFKLKDMKEIAYDEFASNKEIIFDGDKIIIDDIAVSFLKTIEEQGFELRVEKENGKKARIYYNKDYEAEGINLEDEIVIDPTITLQTADSDNLEDGFANELNPSTEYGGDDEMWIHGGRTGGSGFEQHPLIKFNISAIPGGSTISNAEIKFYIFYNSLDSSGEGWNTSVYHVYENFSWTEGTGGGAGHPCQGNDYCWNNMPTSGYYNPVRSDYLAAFGGAGEPDGWQSWDVGSLVQEAIDSGEKNISLWIFSEDPFGSATSGDNIRVYSKEETDTSVRPILNITYGIPSGANETEGDNAISQGIDNSIPSASKYSDQQIYAVDVNNNQDLGKFDWVAVYLNQTWAFNYVTDSDPTSDFTNMFNITPVLYVLELQYINSTEITNKVSVLIDETKQ